ncbi:MAG: ECF transporter S component [Bacilli bacterium]|nr:ECF transporter S component [Bacilli bacterium]
MDRGTTLIIAVTGIIVIFVLAFLKKNRKMHMFTTKFITRTALFAAISIVLYLVPYFNIALPFFPSFLKVHIDEVPAFIAGFAYGPLSAIFILLVKTIAKLPLSFSGGTHGVGELADLIYSLAFILPASIIYRKNRSLKGAVLGMSISFFIQLAVASFLTTFVMIKFYIFVMGWNEHMILSMCQAVNPAIKSLDWPFFFIVALPFNAFKNVVVIGLTLLLYKRLHAFIDKQVA